MRRDWQLAAAEVLELGEALFDIVIDDVIKSGMAGEDAVGEEAAPLAETGEAALSYFLALRLPLELAAETPTARATAGPPRAEG